MGWRARYKRKLSQPCSLTFVGHTINEIVTKILIHTSIIYLEQKNNINGTWQASNLTRNKKKERKTNLIRINSADIQVI